MKNRIERNQSCSGKIVVCKQERPNWRPWSFKKYKIFAMFDKELLRLVENAEFGFLFWEPLFNSFRTKTMFKIICQVGHPIVSTFILGTTTQQITMLVVWAVIKTDGRSSLVFIVFGVNKNAEYYRKDFSERVSKLWTLQHFNWTQEDRTPLLERRAQKSPKVNPLHYCA